MGVRKTVLSSRSCLLIARKCHSGLGVVYSLDDNKVIKKLPYIFIIFKSLFNKYQCGYIFIQQFNPKDNDLIVSLVDVKVIIH